MTTPWQGTLKLTYAKRGEMTRVIDAYSQSPLKLQRSFHPDGQTCQSLILHTAGGIVGGDRLNQEITLHPQAEASLTTVSASKLYRSSGPQSQQTLTMSLDRDAYLEYIPRESIVFDGAKFQQQLRVNLGENAVWLGWELLRFGRTARGERFNSGDWRSQTEVYRNGVPLWIDRQQLAGGSPLLDASNGLNGQPVVGTLAWIGQPVSPEIADKARHLWEMRDLEGEIAVSCCQSGVICRYRGRSTQKASAAFLDLRQLLRQSHGDRPVTVPRVWSC
jgi:urease accessory protein